MKTLVNITLIGSLIGFLIYLSFIVLSYISCCVNMEIPQFHMGLLIILLSGSITFGVCLYQNCYKNTK